MLKKKWNIDFSKSWMIGDSESDILCGKNAGCKTIRILYNNEKTNADYVVNQLYDCIKIINK